ncbi:MAG TPA: DUF1638 domain-containing protein [Phycisphaerae bacterium]|nr:DUF1638 domain-containing protein [Phycisphaerae bacterium]
MQNTEVRTLPVENTSIVACGTLRQEIKRLVDEGRLDADRVLYTGPGLHEWPDELESQLTRQLGKVCGDSTRVVVAYGHKCFVDIRDPTRDTDALICQACPHAVRAGADNCVDMLAGREERERLAAGDKVYWLTPGWLLHWDTLFKDWDAAKANETFPQHDRAVVLDGIGFFETFSAAEPERLLKISDWMKLPIEAAPVSLDRLRDLLAEAVGRPGVGGGPSASQQSPQRR